MTKIEVLCSGVDKICL